MRTMLRVAIPAETGNAAVRDGTLPKTLETLIGDLKPEAAYFYPDGGERSFIMVFDMKDASQIPAIAERLFMGFNALVEIFPVMNADDLKAGLDVVMRHAGA